MESVGHRVSMDLERHRRLSGASVFEQGSERGGVLALNVGPAHGQRFKQDPCQAFPVPEMVQRAQHPIDREQRSLRDGSAPGERLGCLERGPRFRLRGRPVTDGSERPRDGNDATEEGRDPTSGHQPEWVRPVGWIDGQHGTNLQGIGIAAEGQAPGRCDEPQLPAVGLPTLECLRRVVRLLGYPLTCQQHDPWRSGGRERLGASRNIARPPHRLVPRQFECEQPSDTPDGDSLEVARRPGPEQQSRQRPWGCHWKT